MPTCRRLITHQCTAGSSHMTGLWSRAPGVRIWDNICETTGYSRVLRRAAVAATKRDAEGVRPLPAACLSVDPAERARDNRLCAEDLQPRAARYLLQRR